MSSSIQEAGFAVNSSIRHVDQNNPNSIGDFRFDGRDTVAFSCKSNSVCFVLCPSIALFSFISCPYFFVQCGFVNQFSISTYWTCFFLFCSFDGDTAVAERPSSNLDARQAIEVRVSCAKSNQTHTKTFAVGGSKSSLEPTSNTYIAKRLCCIWPGARNRRARAC